MKPLGLPEGSVRALLAAAALAGAIFMWVTERAITDFQQTIVTVAITYYFATRGGATSAEPPPPGEMRDLLEEARRQRGIKP